MKKDVDEIVSRLMGAHDWRAIDDQVERWARKSANVPFLAALHARLASLDDPDEIAFRSVREQIEIHVALTRSGECARHAFDFLQMMPRGPTSWLPGAIVQAQSWDHVRQGITCLLDQTSEASLAIAMEMSTLALYRRRARASDPVIQRCWRDVQCVHGDLAWVPPDIVPEERLLEVAEFLGSGILRVSSHVGAHTKEIEDRSSGALGTLEQVGQEELPAFESMLARSNARVECVRAPVKGVGPSTIVELGETFEPLKGGTGCFKSSLEDGVLDLLSCAVHGGAYDSGQGAARGRAAAWRTIGTLVGESVDARFDDVLECARRCTWLWCEPSTAWFDDVAWDGCVACLVADQTLTVLAWTDTD